ncbi:MAG TPA: hypothetical protein VMY77_12505 [Chitinophagaceae bacterium]|nr:hypothetical protein [Chitinophagaceae bacterium]
MNNNQTETTEAKCCLDFCITNFHGTNEQVINNYKCNDKKFSSPDLWNIQKSRREFTRRTSNFAIN